MNGPLHSQKPKWVPPFWFIPFVFVAGICWIIVEIIFGNPLFAVAGGLLLALASYEFWKNRRGQSVKSDDGGGPESLE